MDLTTRFACPLPAVAAAAWLLAVAPLASAGVLYSEMFNDDTFAANTNMEGEVVAGVGVFLDDSTGGKTVFNVVETYNQPLLTFSFDVVSPVVPVPPAGNQTELMFRAGVGDGTDSIGSGDDILEVILNRDLGNRDGYQNNGNESVFIVANNSNGPTTFASPVDGSDVTLNNQEYVAFIRDNLALPAPTWVVTEGPEAWLTPNTPGVITRFFIGSSSNGDQQTFSLDNIGVVDEISFATVVPEPASLMLLAVGGVLTLRVRRWCNL